MSSAHYTSEYIHYRQRGPFPGRIDPWAEDSRYFQQVHSGLIYNLQDQLQDVLNERGYQIGKEASLQIFAEREPDLYVQRAHRETELETQRWDYEAATAELLLEPGTAVIDAEPELESLHIRDMQTGDLVTVIEVISPGNKTQAQKIAAYKEQRSHLFLDQGVNVVEIDATRSVKRLLQHPLVLEHPYHIAIYLPGDLPRVLVGAFEQPLAKFALPLRAEVIPVDPQTAYERAYQRGGIAGLIFLDNDYAPDHLPFPSLLTDEQRQIALDVVAAWKAELERLTQQA